MKLVREHINEAFTDDSDPIADIGISILHILAPGRVLRCKMEIKPRLIKSSLKHFVIKPGWYSIV